MDVNFIAEKLPFLLEGSKMTIELTILSLVLGSVLGILLAIFKISKNKFLYSVSALYIWIFRGTPLILQLFFVYYGLPQSWAVTSFSAALIALSLNCGAYMAEIIRGGIISIDKGQFEASKALGFTYIQTMIKIILPQTFRVILPPLGNEFVSMLKDTSLVSTIAMVELMRTAQSINSSTYKTVEMFFTAGCLYLLMTTVFTTTFSHIEKKLSVY